MVPRRKRVTCLFCGARVTLVRIPAEDDSAAWDRIRGQHDSHCAWAHSRAGRRWNYEAPAEEPSSAAGGHL